MGELLAQVFCLFAHFLPFLNHKRTKYFNVINICSESWPRNQWSYNNIWARTSCGLLHALHEPWNQHPLQEAAEEAARSVFFSIPSFTGCLDLHSHGVSWCLHTSFHTRKVNTNVNQFQGIKFLFFKDSALMSGTTHTHVQRKQRCWWMSLVCVTRCGLR